MIRWRAVVLREGVWTDDGRLIEAGETSWTVPLPLLGDPHSPGPPVGSVEAVWRADSDVWAEGTGPDGRWWPTADVDAPFVYHVAPEGISMRQVTLRAVTASPDDGRVWPDLPFEVLGPA